MNNLTVIVGDTQSYLADYAYDIDQQSYLVEYANLKEDHSGVVYTSIGDVGLEGLINILFKANKIIYCPPSEWSDNATINDRYSMAQSSYIHCKLISTLQQVTFDVCNINDTPSLDAPCVTPRQSQTPNLWIAGCSTTAGSAIDLNEVYWKYVSNKLDISTVNLALASTSLQWQSDQLLRADLQKGDKIIWGLTNSNRFPWYITGDVIEHIGIRFFEKPEAKKFKGIVTEKTVTDFHWHHVGIRAIRQVENFCKKMEVDLLLAGIHVDNEISSLLCSQSNFVMINEECGLGWNSAYLDFGTDNLHPGPKTHKMYSEKILNRIDNLGWT